MFLWHFILQNLRVPPNVEPAIFNVEMKIPLLLTTCVFILLLYGYNIHTVLFNLKCKKVHKNIATYMYTPMHTRGGSRIVERGVADGNAFY